MIVGTVRNQVKLDSLNSQWQLKKQTAGQSKNTELTAEERELQFLQEQADSVRKGNQYAAIDAKIKSGATLTADEIEYLRANNPSALKAYEDAKREKEEYKNQLKNCRTKEDVERLKLQKMGCFMAEAKEISNNPYIPKGKKLEMMGKLLSEVTNVAAAHIEFTQSQAYRDLPTEEELKENRSSKSDTGSERELVKTEEDNDVDESGIIENDAVSGEVVSPDIEESGTEVTFEQIETEIKDYIKNEHTDAPQINITV